MFKRKKVDPAMDWVNPYRTRRKDYPERIFCFEDFDADHARVQALLPISNRETAADGLFVEIGSGSGIHLIEQGRRLPHSVFFGFELRFKRAVRTIEKANKYEVPNVFVLNCDASEVSRIFPAASIDGIYVNFPDPWAKPRQLKHRLFSVAFLDSAASLLKPGGFISFKTDHSEYFLSVLELFAQDRRFSVEHVTNDLHGDETKVSHENVLTEFEQMFVRQSLAVGYLSVRLQRQPVT